jgi:hypothetical protein
VLPIRVCLCLLVLAVPALASPPLDEAYARVLASRARAVETRDRAAVAAVTAERAAAAAVRDRKAAAEKQAQALADENAQRKREAEKALERIEAWLEKFRGCQALMARQAAGGAPPACQDELLKDAP